MNTRRISVALPCPIAEDLAAMAVRSGVRRAEIVVEALRQFEPFKHYAGARTRAMDERRGATQRAV